MSRSLFLLLVAGALHAEVHPMTLRQAVETALRQSPDLVLARLEEQHAREAIRVAHGPFTPALTVGSGLAYGNGFPMSIEGSAPSVFQARANQFLFNRQQSFTVAQAKEDSRGAAIATAGKRDDVAYRVASLFLDAERAARIGELARKDADSQEKVLAAVRAQVQEGRALPLAEKTAAYQLAYARQAASNFADDQDSAETSLAVTLGYSAEDRVRPAEEQRPAPALPQSEAEALETAMETNKDLRHIQSQIASKQLEIRGEKAARWPRVDLVAQYAMLAKFNNYAEFFRAFQRNNGQVGVSFQVPILSGAGVGAQIAQSETDVSHLRAELSNTRNRIASDLQQSFRDVHKAEGNANVAQLDLDVTREQLSVNLAQMQEGRLSLRDVEQARVVENQKWIAFYDAQYALEKARWNVLRLTGELVPAVEGVH
jgi:adhesin transport system outer membrane protein